MKIRIKEEKGITGIDIVVAIVIIVIFSALITTLYYNINTNSKAIERKSDATYYAIAEIEAIKNMDFEQVQSIDNTEEYPEGEVIANTPYTKKIIVIDYADMEGNEDKLPNVVKKVTVEILYKNNQEIEKVELSTIVTAKEN